MMIDLPFLLSSLLKNPLACHSERSEESLRSFVSRARFLAEFTLSGQSDILRCAQDDSEGLGMTAIKRLRQDSENNLKAEPWVDLGLPGGRPAAINP
jgi:hypothetical protein